MKKIISIIFMVMAVNAFTQVDVIGSGEIGIFPTYQEWDFNDSFEAKIFSEYVTYVDVELYLTLGFDVFIGGNVRTLMSKSVDVWTFVAFNSDSYIGIYWELGNMTIGFEHNCAHPINHMAGALDPLVSKNIASDRFYARIEF